jgi:hypothetical protein
MKLLATLDFSNLPDFEIEEDLVQGVTENPNIIGEQLIFVSDLDFDHCLQRLTELLTAVYGKPVNSASSEMSGVKSCATLYNTPFQEITTQLTCEGEDYVCRGYIHVKTAWTWHSYAAS